MAAKSNTLLVLLLTTLLTFTPALADRIAAGGDHSLAVRGNGDAFAWGANEAGQLGDGSDLDALNPLPVVDSRYHAVSGAIAVTAYGNNSLLLMDDGTLLGWGDNDNGQLGSGALYASWYKPFGDQNQEGTDTEDPELAEDVVEDTGNPIEFPTEVVDAAGTPIANVIAVATGTSFTAALRQDTTVVVWGDLSAFDDAEVERYDREPYRDKFLDPETEFIDSPYLNGDPDEIAELRVMRDAAEDAITGIMAIAVGDDYLLALTSEGYVLAWGANDAGQLGDGTMVRRTYPVTVRGADGAPLQRITSIAARNGVSMAVRSDGALFGWGDAQVVLPAPDPGRPVSDNLLARPVTDGRGYAIGGVRKVVLGESHTVAIRLDNTVMAWGANDTGQLGDSTNAATDETTTVVTADGQPLTNIYEIAAGNDYTLALRADGALFAWGLGENGQLGDGTNVSSYYAVRVRNTRNLPFSVY